MIKYIKFLFTFLLFCGSVNAQIQEPVKWNYHINESGEIIFLAVVDAGWHLYDLDLPEGGPLPTVFEFEEIKGAELDGKVASKSKIISQYDDMFEMNVRWFGENPTFIQKLKIKDKANFLIKGNISYMACNDKSCMPGSEEFQFGSKDIPKNFTDKNSVEATPVSLNNEKDSNTEIQTQETNQISQSADQEAVTEKITEAGDYWKPVIQDLQNFGSEGSNSKPVMLIFVLGFIGGLLALLTPCVWPVIPMTVSFFLKRAKDNRKKAISDAIAYGLAIIVIYVASGLLITLAFGASALNDLSTNAIFNLLFFAILVVFAMSFLGTFELILPASWTSKIDSKADSTTGLISIFFMAFTLVLVSFSCTGPIIGTLLVEAAGMSDIGGPAIGMFGFALALAIPFALFAVFPSFLQSIPKSGGWLNSVKVTLGFIELALALKFLSVADLAYGWHILDREVFLVLWIVIFALLGFYLLGKIKFVHDNDLPYLPVSRLFLAIISLAFALYMLPGLWGAPLKAISAFSPPLHTQDFNLYHGAVHPQYFDYDEGMAYARKNNKPVMIDFTGHGCVNCRKMEAAVWTDAQVKGIIENDYVLISLYVDDKTKLSEPIEITEYNKTKKLRTVGEKWSYLQRYKFGANAQPFYVLLNNDGFPIAPSRAYDENIEEYIRFLQNGIKVYNK